MRVLITETKSNSEIKSKISFWRDGWITLPSIIDGWRFNFKKHSKGENLETYVLCTDSTPDIIEGCLVIKTNSEFELYMALVEVSPQNRGSDRKYDEVAGCLIAFACRLSFIKNKEGYLAFDVLERKKENEVKLMELYCQKYNAIRFGSSTTMLILPEGSEKLINEYLKWK